MLKNIRPKILNNKTHLIVLFILLLVLVILRLPSIFEPHWNSLEGFYASVTHFVIKDGVTLYKDIYANAPPGIFFIYSIAGKFGAYNVLAIKILNLFFSAFSVILIYAVSRKLFTSKVSVVSAGGATILLGLPILGTNIAVSENFFLPFLLAAILFLIRKKKRITSILFSSFLFFLAFFFDGSSIFTFAAASLYLFITSNNKLKESAVFFIGFGACILLLSIALTQLNLFVYVKNIYLQTFSQDFFQTYDSLGFVLFSDSMFTRLLVFCLIILFIFVMYSRKLFSKKSLLLSLWIAFSGFAVLHNQAPQIHYLIQIVPPFSIILSLIIRRLKNHQTFSSAFYNTLLAFLSTISFLNFFTRGDDLHYYLDVSDYYVNFVRYLTGRKDTEKYISFFDADVQNVYRLNSYIQQIYPQQKNIFLWTDNPWLYTLIDLNLQSPYIFSFEAKDDFDQVKSSIVRYSPQIIVITKNSKRGTLLEKHIRDQFVLENTFEENKIYIREEEI